MRPSHQDVRHFEIPVEIKHNQHNYCDNNKLLLPKSFNINNSQLITKQ